MEDAVSLVAPEERERFAVLGPGYSTQRAVHGVIVLITGLIAQLEQHVLVVGAVSADAVAEVAELLLPGEVELETGVPHIAYVAPGQVVAYVGRQGHGHKHAVRALVVVVQRQAQLVVPKAHVSAQVELGGFLPLQVGVGISAGDDTGGDGRHSVHAEHITGDALHHRSVGEGTDVLVTVHSVAHAHLGAVHPHRTVRHKGFVGQIPTHGDRREVGPLVGRREIGRAVTAHSQLHHIAFTVVVAQTGEIRSQPAERFGRSAGAAHIGILVRGVDPRLLHIADLVARAADVVSAVGIGALAKQRGEVVVLAEGEGVRKSVLHLPGVTPGNGRPHLGTGVLVVGVHVVRDGVAVVLDDEQVRSHRGFELQSLDYFEFGVSAGHYLVLNVVVCGQVQHSHRIGHCRKLVAHYRKRPSLRIPDCGRVLRQKGVGIFRIERENRRKGKGAAQH